MRLPHPDFLLLFSRSMKIRILITIALLGLTTICEGQSAMQLYEAALALKEKGDSAKEDGKIADGLPYWRVAERKYKEAGAREQEIQTAIWRLKHAAKIQPFQQVERELLDMIANSNQADTCELIIRIKLYAALSSVSQDQGQYAKNSEYCSIALDLARGLKNPGFKELAFIYGNYGLKYYSEGDYLKAREYLRKDYQILRRVPDARPKDHAVVTQNLGNTFWGTSEFDSAAVYYRKAQKIFLKIRKPGSKYITLSYNAMGTIFWDAGNQDSALHYYNLAAENERVRNPDGVPDKGGKLHQSGEAELQAGNSGEALSYFRKALKRRRRDFGPNSMHTAGCYNYIAAGMLAEGNIDSALQAYQVAMIMLVPGFSDSSVDANPTQLDSVSSGPYLLSALEGKSRLLRKVADSTRKVEDYLKAYNTDLVGAEVIDRLRRSHMSESSKRFWTGRVIPFYAGAVRSAVALSRLTEEDKYGYKAFLYSEKARSYTLLQGVRSMEAKKFGGVPDSILQRERQIVNQISNYDHFLGNEEMKCNSASENKVNLWKEKLFESKREHEKIVMLLREKYPDYYSIKYSTEVSDPSAVSKWLSKNHSKASVLEFFADEEVVNIFHIDADGIQIATSPIDADFKIAVSALIESVYSRDSSLTSPDRTYDKYVRAARLLHKKLVEPIEGNLAQDEKVIVIPSGKIHGIPFELLLSADPEGEGRNYRNLPYLIRDYQFSYAPSATVLLELGGRTSATRGQWLGFAPLFPGAMKLDQNELELAKANSIYRGKSFVGEQASKENFFSNSSRASVIHLATHAMVDHTNPSSSQILFASSDTTHESLFLHEIYQLQVAAKLVILSACNTGSGELVQGEGVISLGRGFSYAGCPSVAMSYWKVDDESNASLLTSFYEHLSNGLDVTAALRNAKLDFLENADPAQSHPFFWSAMIITGDPGTVVKPAMSPWLWYLVFAVLIAAIAFSGRRSISLGRKVS